jgi:hypothetical protein
MEEMEVEMEAVALAQVAAAVREDTPAGAVLEAHVPANQAQLHQLVEVEAAEEDIIQNTMIVVLDFMAEAVAVA